MNDKMCLFRKTFSNSDPAESGEKGPNTKSTTCRATKTVGTISKSQFLQNFKQFLSRKNVETRVYQVTET